MPKTAVAEAKEVKRLRDKEALSWAKVAEQTGLTVAQAMLAYGEADTGNKITGTDEQIKKEVAKQRKQGVSWGVLMARSGKSLTFVRSAYEDITGNTALGDSIGRGGRTPGSGSNNGAKPKKAVKKATKKAPAKAVKKATKKAPAAKKARAAKKMATKRVAKEAA